MENLYLIILLFFIILLIFPLGCTIKANLNVFENKGSFSIKIWIIWFKIARFKFKGKNVVLIIKNKKKEEVEIEISEPEYRFLIFFQNEVQDKVKVRNLEMTSHIGAENPFIAALFSSFVSNTFLCLFSRLKINNPTASYKQENFTNFDNYVFEVALTFRFSLSLFDIIYSFLISILRSKGEEHERI